MGGETIMKESSTAEKFFGRAAFYLTLTGIFDKGLAELVRANMLSRDDALGKKVEKRQPTSESFFAPFRGFGMRDL
jgi:hypothetical protein